ncbi:MAG: alanine--tRNA ligase, partial [Selenomonadaceae bacterium]|nr:alanine--tRNA ligase [Selenomonadaceae bacterium]
PDRLRFDFSNFEPVSEQQLADVQELVNEQILKGTDVEISHMPLDEAKKLGAMALFGEKYGDVVRVVQVPGFSMELCGGSHVRNVGQIGIFKIVSETGVAAGVRRIEAITGRAAMEYAREQQHILQKASALLKTRAEDLPTQLEKLLASQKEMQKQLDEVHEMQEKADAQKLLMAVQEIGDLQVVVGRANATGMEELRNIADVVCGNLKSGVVVLAAPQGTDKVSLVVKADKGAVAKGIHAGKIIKEVAAMVGGGGGGRPDMAQAGGKQPENLPKAFEKANEMIRAQVK